MEYLNHLKPKITYMSLSMKIIVCLGYLEWCRSVQQGRFCKKEMRGTCKNQLQRHTAPRTYKTKYNLIHPDGVTFHTRVNRRLGKAGTGKGEGRVEWLKCMKSSEVAAADPNASLGQGGESLYHPLMLCCSTYHACWPTGVPGWLVQLKCLNLPATKKK